MLPDLQEGSILAVNAKAAFGVDLLIMGTAATVIYSTLFRKTGHNVLYVLLIGTVLNSFFGSVQSALTRIMDPNEYDSLKSTGCGGKSLEADGKDSQESVLKRKPVLPWP